MRPLRESGVSRRDVASALAGTVVLASAAVLVFGGGQALGSHVGCGETITADTTLDSDLIDCPNNGLVIGADDVTLNLNGHLIDGDGLEAVGCNPEVEFCDVGVLNEGQDGVTVRNGAVRRFAIGDVVVGARENRVVDIAATRNVFFGLLMGATARSVVRNSSLSRNIAPEGDGMGVFGCRHIRILHNAIHNNPGPGIHIGESSRNLIRGNRLSRDFPAVLMEGNGNRVRRNRVVRGGGILVAPGDRNVIARNRVARALDSVAVDKGHGNLLAHNVVVDSRGAGIRLAIRRPAIGTSRSIVRRNEVRRSGEDGFLVNPKDRHSILRRNRAIGSRDDGFDVASGAATLTRNRAVRNGDLGIEAAVGVTDGGGNVAWGNGDPLQCRNILCG